MRRFVVSLLLLSQTALAQSPDSTLAAGLPPKSDFGSGFFAEIGLTATSTSLPAFRSFLKRNQIKPDLHLDPFFNLGIGGRYRRLKLMLQSGYGVQFSNLLLAGTDVNAPRHDPADQPWVARQTYAGFAGALVGFDLLNARNQRLYLNAGYGSVTYAYSLYRQTSQPVAFPDILQAGQAGSVPSLSVFNNYWDVNLELAQREKRKRSAESVFRIGYRRGIQPRAWRSDAFPLTGAPTERISQFYIQGTYYFSSNYSKSGKR